MLITQTIEPHGPDHYVNSWSGRTRRKSSSQIARKQPWRISIESAKTGAGAYLYYRSTNAQTDKYFRFCREIFGPDVSQVERLRNNRLRDVQVYMRWLLDTSNMQKLNIMATRMKAWLMMYRDDVGHPLDVNMRFQMNTVPSLQVFVFMDYSS